MISSIYPVLNNNCRKKMTMSYELNHNVGGQNLHYITGTHYAAGHVSDYTTIITSSTYIQANKTDINSLNVDQRPTTFRQYSNRKPYDSNARSLMQLQKKDLELPITKCCNKGEQPIKFDCWCKNTEVLSTTLVSSLSPSLLLYEENSSYSDNNFSSSPSTCDMCCRVLTLDDGQLYKTSDYHNLEDVVFKKRQPLCDIFTNAIVGSFTLLILWLCCRHWRYNTTRRYVRNKKNPLINIVNRNSENSIRGFQCFTAFLSQMRFHSRHRKHCRHIITKLYNINMKKKGTLRFVSKEFLVQNLKSAHIILTISVLLMAQEVCRTDASLADLSAVTNIPNENIGQIIHKIHNRSDGHVFTENHDRNITNYKDNLTNNNSNGKKSDHLIKSGSDNSQLKHSPSSVLVGTDVVISDDDDNSYDGLKNVATKKKFTSSTGDSSVNNHNNNNAYLDRMDNLERSLEAVLIKVAYGTTSTTKRSIPDNSQVPSLTTIVTPLLTTLRHQNMRSSQQHSLDTHHRNYELDLERDHALPTSAPNADILKSNSNPTYPNPNRHHNSDREKYRNSTPIPPSLPNILKKNNEQLATIPMFAGNAPSHMPPLRSFFTPPLPKEYQHPFADKPTLRGTNSDGVILPNTGSFTNRRPIPPPSLMPGHERIPFRPPDLAVINGNGGNDNTNGDLSPLSSSSVVNGLGATTVSSANVQGPLINGGLYERKKVLNTPSKGNDLLNHDNDSKHNQNENPSIETTATISGINANPSDNSNPNIRKEVLPIIRRILSGSNGRKDDIHEVLLKHVTTRRPINGQQQQSSSAPLLYNKVGDQNLGDQQQRTSTQGNLNDTLITNSNINQIKNPGVRYVDDNTGDSELDSVEAHKTKLSTNTGSEYVSIGLNAISPTSSSSSFSLSSSSAVGSIPESTGTNSDAIAHNAAASSASSFATSPSFTNKNINNKQANTNYSNKTRMNTISSSSSTLAASTAHSTWNVAWNIHVYLSVILFTMLTVYSLYKMVTYNKLTHLFTQSYFICIHVVLIIICSTRVFYLCYDAYNIHGTFQTFMSEILLNLPSLLLTVCFSVLILFLSLKSLNRKNSRYSALIRPITVIIGCGVHILLCITLHYVESYTMHNQQQQQQQQQLWRRQHIQMQMQLQQQQQQQQYYHHQQYQQQTYLHNQPEYRTFQYTSMNEQPRQYFNDHSKLMGVAALAATPLALSQHQQMSSGLMFDELLSNGTSSNAAAMAAAAAAAAVATPPRVLSLICQIIYTFVCFSLGLLYLYLYRILKRILRSKSQNYIHCYQNLSYAIHITIATALLFVLLAALHVFGAISISTMRPLMAQISPDIDWLQWGYQFSLRLIEIAIITLISWVSGLKTGGSGGSNGSVTVGVSSGGGAATGGVHMTLTNGDTRIIPYRTTNMFDSTRSVGSGTGISAHMHKTIGYSHEKHRRHLHAHSKNPGNASINNGSSGGSGGGTGNGGGFFLTCTSSSSKENIETDYPSVYNANTNLHTYTMRTGKLIYDNSYSLNTIGNNNTVGSGIPLSPTDIQIGNSNYSHHYQTTPQPAYQHPYDNDSTHSSIHCQPHRGHHHHNYVSEHGAPYGNDDPSIYCEDDYASDNAADHYENPNFDLRGSGSAASATSANSTSGPLAHNSNVINSDVQKFSKSSTISTTTALSSNNSNDSNSVAASATSALSAASVASQQQVLLIPDNNSYSEPLQLQQSGYEFHNLEKPKFSGHQSHHNDDNWSQQQRQMLYNSNHDRSNNCNAHNQLEFCAYNPVDQRHPNTNGSQHSCYIMNGGTLDGTCRHSIYNSSDRKIHNSVRLKKHDNFVNSNTISNNTNGIHDDNDILSPSASSSGSSPSSASASSIPSTASSSNSTRGGLCTTQTAGDRYLQQQQKHHQNQQLPHNYHPKIMPTNNQQLPNAFEHSARLDHINNSQISNKSRSQVAIMHARSQSPSAYSDDDENESDMMLADNSNTTPQPSILIRP